MKLSKKRREEVVMILRCAAEAVELGDPGLFGAVRRCSREDSPYAYSDEVEACLIALEAFRADGDKAPIHWHPERRIATLLSAAIRVEEGSLP